MIIDADTHYVPRTLISEISDPDYVEKCLDSNRHVNRQAVWQNFYNNIKDPSWPDCGDYQRFSELPLFIRKEIKEMYPDSHIVVTEDLSQIVLDKFQDDTPLLRDFMLGLEHFVKVDRALINPQADSMLMQYGTESALAVEIMKAWNRHIVDLCQQHSFLDGNAWLALQDIEASIDELKFIAENDFFGIYVSDRMPWGLMPQFDPVFEICEKHGIPVYFHFSLFEDVPLRWSWDRNNTHYDTLKQQWRSLEEGWYIAIASLIVGGLLDRYPKLKIVITERGVNWMPVLRDFMLQQGWKDPLPYYKKNFWTTFEIEHPFQEVAKLIGWDRLLFSSDYPHDDPGGDNRYNDVDMLKSYVNDGKITQDQFDLITHNYLKVKSRE